ncbi:MAG: Grx4 family monothiol glutaredoxin [Alphaproteobacteria bacterium]|nr:Grx4 family monothiol glutaredoxin [Alphaproteobacteria bacterium]
MVNIPLKTNQLFEDIKKDIASNNVIIYMKGTPEMPMCGFSGYVIQIFKKYNVEFKAVNVLSNEGLRQAIKEFSDWPTIPQIYIKGEFIGGCDILRDLHESNELIQLLEKCQINFQKPALTAN